ncbi:hypothetical protein OXX79_002516 [Metschnikowia pulcherrima]
MNLEGVVDDQLSYLHHILDTVPFAPNAMVNGYFLDIYKLTFAEISSLNITEKTWEAYNQVPVNRLLKLSISFGNLIKTFHLEKSHHEARNGAQQNHQNSRKPSRQSVDPFQDTFTDEKAFSVAPYHLSFAKNFYLILKNFDIGSAAGSIATSGGQVARRSQNLRNGHNENDATSFGNGRNMNSPIRLNSRQLLIEKLEINICLDALFTFKITVKLLERLFLVLKQSLGNYTPQEEPIGSSRKSPSENSSIFSSISGISAGLDSITSVDDYARLIAEISHRICVGILDPFVGFLRESIVKPHVLGGFQDLINTI